MRKYWTIAIGACALALAIGGRAGAQGQCPDNGGTRFIVDDAADAADIADGYSNTACDVEILFPILSTVKSLSINANTLVCTGASIRNEINRASIRIKTTGNITGTNCDIVSADLLSLTCTDVACDILWEGGDLIASPTLDDTAVPPGFVGKLVVTAGDMFTFDGGTFFGLIQVLFKTGGDMTLFCGGDVIDPDCTDPLDDPFAARQLCDPIGNNNGVLDAGDFPCNPTFNNESEIREVCFPRQDVPGQCRGGIGETQFSTVGATPGGDLIIEGLVYDAFGHINFYVDGSIFGMGAQLTAAGPMNMRNVGDTIDFRNASLDTTDNGAKPKNADITQKPDCVSVINPADICIDLDSATLRSGTVTCDPANGIVNNGTIIAPINNCP